MATTIDLSKVVTVKHFSQKELSCPCCDAPVAPELILALDYIRGKFGKPLKVNSGRRCHKHNKLVGGVAGSMHLEGLAADISMLGFSPNELWRFHKLIFESHFKFSNGIEKYFGGIGFYKNFVHVDLRDNGVLWTLD